MRLPLGGAIFNQAIQLPAAINLTLRPVTMNPLEVNLDIVPNSRFQLIDVSARIREEAGDCLEEFRKVLYCSFHTTAGYLEQGASARLGNSRKQLDPFFRMVQRIFPPDAGYFHDRMRLRDELSDSLFEPFVAIFAIVPCPCCFANRKCQLGMVQHPMVYHLL